MVAVKMNQASVSELKSLLKEVFGMKNADMICSISDNHVRFGQYRRVLDGKVFGHQNLVTLRVYDTGETTQYDVVVKPHDDHRWALELRTESLVEAAKLISEKVVK